MGGSSAVKQEGERSRVCMTLSLSVWTSYGYTEINTSSAQVTQVHKLCTGGNLNTPYVHYLSRQLMGASVWNIQNKDPFVEATKEPPYACTPVLKLKLCPCAKPGELWFDHYPSSLPSPFLNLNGWKIHMSVSGRKEGKAACAVDDILLVNIKDSTTQLIHNENL